MTIATWAKIDEDLYAADEATSSLYATRVAGNVESDARYIHQSTARFWDFTTPPVFSTAPGFTRCVPLLHPVDRYVATVTAQIWYDVANGAGAAGTDGVRARLRVGGYIGAWSALTVTSATASAVLTCSVVTGRDFVATAAIEVESLLGANVLTGATVFGGGAYQPHVHIDSQALDAGKAHYAIEFTAATSGDPDAARRFWHIGHVLEHTHGGGSDSLLRIWPYLTDTETMMIADDAKIADADIYHVGRITLRSVALWSEGSDDLVPPISRDALLSRAPMRAEDLLRLEETLFGLRDARARVWGAGAHGEATAAPIFGARVTGGGGVLSSACVIRRPATTGVEIIALAIPLRPSATAITITVAQYDDAISPLDSTTATIPTEINAAPAREVGDNGSGALFNAAHGNDPATWGQADTCSASDIDGGSGAPVVLRIGMAWDSSTADGDALVFDLSADAGLHVFDAIWREVY